MRWIREGDSPDQIKISLVISAKEHPELAAFIWSLPYRGASKALRDILSSAVKSASSELGEGMGGANSSIANTAMLDGKGPPVADKTLPQNQAAVSVESSSHDHDDDEGEGTATQSEGRVSPGPSPSIEQVSAHAADIIGRFDKMFSP